MLFSPGASVFRLANSLWSIEIKRPLLTLIIRAKKNCVAYFEAEKSNVIKPGRPRIYGEKVKLYELFDHAHLFAKTKCAVYGKVEKISFASVDLLWKPTGTLIRFVLAVTSRGPIVLMCNDLQQDPLIALELYCVRVRIETMFDMLKNVMGAFKYRFWTKALPRHSRTPVKNKDLTRPAQKQIRTVKSCLDAYQRFVMTAAISLGLLQMIALKYRCSVWNRLEGFLRTRSREVPSERTVKSVIRHSLLRNLHCFASDGVIQEILKRYGKVNDTFEEEDSFFVSEMAVPPD